MRLFFHLNFLFFFLNLNAQVNGISGTWHGILIQPGMNAPFSNYAFWLTLTQEGDSVKGFSRIEINNTGFFGVIKLNGTFKNDQFEFREFKIDSESVEKNKFIWCIKKGTLKYYEGTEMLRGNWVAISPKNCSPGEIAVYRTKNKFNDTLHPGTGYLSYDELQRQLNGNKTILGKKVVLENVNFIKTKTEMVEGSEAILQKLISLLIEHPRLKIMILGHTDSDGDDTENLLLSNKRAEVIADYLVKHGVNKEQLSFEGFGESRPVADNRTNEGKAKNRRVEFEILSE